MESITKLQLNYIWKEAAILKLSLKFKIMKLNLFLKKTWHTHTLLTITIFAYYVNNHFMRLI